MGVFCTIGRLLDWLWRSAHLILGEVEVQADSGILLGHLGSGDQKALFHREGRHGRQADSQHGESAHIFWVF